MSVTPEQSLPAALDAFAHWCDEQAERVGVEEGKLLERARAFVVETRMRADDAGRAGGIVRELLTLLAAKADLLACLKEAVQTVGEWDDEEGEGDPIAHWRAAIAKAEGR